MCKQQRFAVFFILFLRVTSYGICDYMLRPSETKRCVVSQLSGNELLSGPTLWGGLAEPPVTFCRLTAVGACFNKRKKMPRASLSSLPSHFPLAYVYLTGSEQRPCTA